MHAINSDELSARKARALPENGQCLASDGATLGKEKLAVTVDRNKFLSRQTYNGVDSRNAFMGHSDDRARHRGYDCFWLVGPHSGDWQRSLAALNTQRRAKLFTKAWRANGPHEGSVTIITERVLPGTFLIRDSLEVSIMSYIDNCRAHALHCLRRAYGAPNDEMKQRWLEVAETWIDMLPEAQVTAEEVLQMAGSGQEDSRTLH